MASQVRGDKTSAELAEAERHVRSRSQAGYKNDALMVAELDRLRSEVESLRATSIDRGERVAAWETRSNEFERMFNEKCRLLDQMSAEVAELADAVAKSRGLLDRSFSEIRKQIFGSRVVFDREIVRMAEETNPREAEACTSVELVEPRSFEDPTNVSETPLAEPSLDGGPSAGTPYVQEDRAPGFRSTWLHTRCSACGEQQFTTPGGDTCINGHGGADSILSSSTEVCRGGT
jgi:hypothetical protein